MNGHGMEILRHRDNNNRKQKDSKTDNRISGFKHGQVSWSRIYKSPNNPISFSLLSSLHLSSLRLLYIFFTSHWVTRHHPPIKWRHQTHAPAPTAPVLKQIPVTACSACRYLQRMPLWFLFFSTRPVRETWTWNLVSARFTGTRQWPHTVWSNTWSAILLRDYRPTASPCLSLWCMYGEMRTIWMMSGPGRSQMTFLICAAMATTRMPKGDLGDGW